MNKTSLLLISLIVAISISQSSAFIGGFGLGLGGFGFGLPFLLMRQRLLALSLIGKRDTESLTIDTNVTISTFCTLSTHGKTLFCTGPIDMFECPIVSKLNDMSSFKLKLADLVIAKPEAVVSVNDVEKLKIVARKSEKFTFVHPVSHVNEFLHIYANKEVKEPGFFVEDVECFRRFVALVKVVEPENFRLSVAITPAI
jgi:hypothetical protein